MFGGYAFAQMYFAGLKRRREAAGGALHGGSGITPGVDWTSMAEAAYQEEQRRERQRREEQDLLELLTADLL